MFKLTIAKGINAGAVASKRGHGRFSLENVFAVPADGGAYLMATDGRAMSAVFSPVEGEMSGPVALPPKALKANGSPLSVEVNGEVRTSGKKTEVFPLPDQDQRFPKLIAIYPHESDLCYRKRVSLDARALADLATALSDKGTVTLYLGDDGKALVVVGTREDGTKSVGLLMPLAQEESGREADKEALAKLRAALPGREIEQKAG